MKRTITLTAEDLDFILISEDSTVATVMFYLHKILQGNEGIQPPNNISEIYKRLDALTHPVKKSRPTKLKADPDATYHSNESMNKAIQVFIRHRDEIKKPMTPRAVESLLNRFKGHTIKECTEAIETSIVAGYQGVFPKQGKEEKPNYSKADYTEGL